MTKPLRSVDDLQDHEQVREYTKYRQARKNDPYYPQYHLWAPDGRINDPNGLCYWKGRYHLFYQAYPPAGQYRQHWGHFVSDDLVHWKDLPLAIYPTFEDAVYSGNICVCGGRAVAMYHAAGRGNAVAVAEDEFLLDWKKLAERAVLPFHPDATPDGHPYRIFDPFLWQEDDGFYSLSGTFYSARSDKTTRLDRMVEHLFRSQDLMNWSYVGELIPGNVFIEIGNDGACPYFLPLGDRYALFFFSHTTGAYCLTGEYDRERHVFMPDRKVKFNYGKVGNALNAPCAMPDGRGGLYLIFNTNDAQEDLDRKGMFSAMIRVGLDAEKIPTFAPVESLESLHSDPYHHKALHLRAFEEVTVPFTAKAADIRLSLNMQTARAVVIRFFKSADSREYTSLTVYQTAPDYVPNGHSSSVYAMLDTTRSSRGSGAIQGRNPEVLPLEHFADGRLSIRILLDKCLSEVFLNNHYYVTQPCYPSLPDSHHLSFEAIGGSALVEEIDCFRMGSIY